MQVQRIEISKLTGDPANARKHPERNIQTIVDSLNRFGQQKPVVIDSSNCVRAGNGTLEAARSLGWTYLDCVVTDLKGSDAIAYAIADNRTSELAEWDSDVLAATLEGLQLESMLEFTGFSDDELAELMEGESNETTSGGLEKAMQLVPDREYVVIMCESEQEWEQMKELLELQSVRRGGYKQGSAFDSVGTQRVLKWSEMIGRLA